MDWSPPAECATAWRDHVTFVINHEKKHVDIVERALGDTNQRWVGRSFEACATTDERAKELVGKEFIEAVSADVDALQERIDREFMDLDNSEKLGDFDCSCHPKPPKVWEGQISGISGGERWSALVSLKLTREDDPVYDYELAKGKIRYSLDATDSFTGCEYKGESGEVEIPPSCAIFLHLFALEKLWIYDGGGQFEYEYMVHVKCPDYEADVSGQGHASRHQSVDRAAGMACLARRCGDRGGGIPRWNARGQGLGPRSWRAVSNLSARPPRYATRNIGSPASSWHIARPWPNKLRRSCRSRDDGMIALGPRRLVRC